MKKLKLSLLAVFIFTSLSASDKLSFLIKGGLNLSNASISIQDVKSPKIKPGVNIGIFGEYMIDDHMGIQSGLVFSTKGTKFSTKEDKFPTNYKSTINFNTLQLPIHFIYKIEIADDMKIGLHAGPYLGYTLSGSWTKDYTGEGEVSTLDIYGKKTPAAFGNFDLGVGFGVGFEYGNCLFDLGYDLGLLDQIKDSDKLKGKLRSNNIYVSVGYRF